jgi:hypothetical protein
MVTMARDDENGHEGAEGLPPEERLQKVLESRWDPAKMSAFMRASKASTGQRLDAHNRGRFEGRLGVDLGDVRIFQGELAEEITRAHNAEALTVGDTGMILMRGSSRFAPGTPAGTALLAHELTHVAQSRPSAISRKAGETDLAEEDESEEEAREEEQNVLAEEMGEMKPPGASAADKDNKDKDRKEKIKEKVLELMREDQELTMLRSGWSPGQDWVR